MTAGHPVTFNILKGNFVDNLPQGVVGRFLTYLKNSNFKLVFLTFLKYSKFEIHFLTFLKYSNFEIHFLTEKFKFCSPTTS